MTFPREVQNLTATCVAALANYRLSHDHRTCKIVGSAHSKWSAFFFTLLVIQMVFGR